MTSPGALLKQYRQRENLTLDQAAHKVGAGSGATWHRWESGVRKIGRNQLSTVSNVTNIPSEKLRPDLAELFGDH